MTLLNWSRGPIPIWATDAFCGPCFHYAMNHAPPGSRTAPSCPECPGMESPQNQQWNRVGGDPSLDCLKFVPMRDLP